LKQTKAILSALRYTKEVLWPDIWFGCKKLAVALGEKLQSEEQLLERFLT
jgi:hypothetical protein